jgi:hypothetical protein
MGKYPACFEPSPMSRTITVYLDTQDYSRLADAEVGRGRGDDLRVLEELRDLKTNANVRFAYSAMNLSELLQYEGGGRELTLRKARAVQSLAGSNAFIDLGKLLAFQIASTAAKAGLIDGKMLPDTPVSTENGWFPDIGDFFSEVGNFKQKRLDMLEEKFRNEPANRKARRAAKANISRMRLGDLPSSAFDAMVKKYPFSRDLFEITLAGYFDGKVTKAEASRALLNQAGEPARFVVWYFEHHMGDHDFPLWLRGAGENVAKAIRQLQSELAPYADNPKAAVAFREMLDKNRVILARKMAIGVTEDVANFGVTEDVLQAILDSEAILLRVPFFRLLSSLIPEYLMAHSVFRTLPRKPRASDGADIMHALTLPYCDLWRGDAYFSALLERHVESGDSKIIKKLEELPTAIRRELQ